MKLVVRTGVSMANYTGHNNSAPDSSFPRNIVTLSSTQEPNPFLPGAPYKEPQFYYQTSATKDLRMGFYGGIFLDIALSDRLSVEPGIAYVQKGIDLNYSESGSGDNSTYYYRFTRSINTNYIAIPVVVKYYLGQRQRFYLAGGMYDAFAVKTNIKDATASKTTLTSQAFPPSIMSESYSIDAVETRVVDCGLVGGAGFNLPLGGRFSVGIDARVNVGLINVNGDSSNSSYVNFSTSTKNINLETGLRVGYALSAL